MLFCFSAIYRHARLYHSMSLTEYKSTYFNEIFSDDYADMFCGEQNIKIKSIHSEALHPTQSTNYKILRKTLHR